MSDFRQKSNPDAIRRRPRADSVRNRELIISVAREAFANRGGDVTLDDIVKLTGLGVGTLYRHFRSRDALIEAVYLTEVERLAAAEKALSAAEAPVEALRKWMLLFVDFMGTKTALRETLGALIGGTDTLYAQSTELIQTAMDTLTERAVASGAIRLEIAPLDLLRALTGVAYADDETGPSRAKSLVDLLIAGMSLK